MTSKPKKTGARKKNGYVMPEPIPKGEILTDTSKKSWKIGPSIGCGGFGEIYSACSSESNIKSDKYPFVIKIEPHGNGPLFVEMHFYMRNCKKEDISEFCQSNGIAHIGIPEYCGSGSHTLKNGNRYRFIVMRRFTRDLNSYYKEAGGKLQLHTVYRLALQMVDILHYIHNRTYVHADIKAANILLDEAMTQAYLVDFGLASHYSTGPFKPDPRKMHNGTIEYTSRDAHLGVQTCRGDFEILMYNLIHWCGGSLPWDKTLTDPNMVQKMKEEAMDNVKAFLNSCFRGQTIPGPIEEFTTLVSKLKHDSTPDYKKYRALFLKALKMLGKSPTGKLEFGKIKEASRKSPRKTRKSDVLDENSDEEKVPLKKSRNENNGTVERALVKVDDPIDDKNLPTFKKKKNTITIEFSSADDVDGVEIKITKKKTKSAAKKQIVQNVSDLAEDEDSTSDIEPDVTPKRSARGNNKNNNYNEDSYENSHDIVKKVAKSTTTKKSEKNIESKWKNCPTIKASKVKKPGEYLSSK